jgi:hypothetical protein
MFPIIDESKEYSTLIRTLKINSWLYQQIKEIAKVKRCQIGVVIDEALADYLSKTESDIDNKELITCL